MLSVLSTGESPLDFGFPSKTIWLGFMVFVRGPVITGIRSLLSPIRNITHQLIGCILIHRANFFSRHRLGE